MWIKLTLTGDVYQQIKQYNTLVERGYTAMMVGDNSIVVNAKDPRDTVMLSLLTESSGIQEHLSFKDFMSSN